MRQYFELWVDPFLTDLIKLYTFYTSANLIQKTKSKVWKKWVDFPFGFEETSHYVQCHDILTGRVSDGLSFMTGWLQLSW